MFISNDRPNVRGLILAGSADFKSELNNSDMFDQRLKAVVIKLVALCFRIDSFSDHWNLG